MKIRFVLMSLVASLYGSKVELVAQSLTTLHSFAATIGATNGSPINSDGTTPLGELILSSNTLYGTTGTGGDFGAGTVFGMNLDGTGFKTIHAFSGSDGASPQASLTLSGQTLYGTTTFEGSWGYGSVFAVNIDGTGFTNLYDFGGQDDGGYPYSTLALDGNTLYGTTSDTLGVGAGTVFRINTDGTGFSTLYQFGGIDGRTPWCGVIVSGSTLYGSTGGGGSFGAGTLFAINTDGTGFTNLYSFAGSSDGSRPNGSLAITNNVLYGNTELGGSTPNSGVIFKLNTDGTGFNTLHTFDAGNFGSIGELIIAGGAIYGTSFQGGASALGSVFAINLDGTGFTNLYSFVNEQIGEFPLTGLVLSGNVLFGTTMKGGTNSNGTVFALSLPSVPMPQLTVSMSSAGIVISWPATAPNLVLQSATDLGPGRAWTSVSSTPVVVNGINAVTNLLSGTQQFFRLSQ